MKAIKTPMSQVEIIREVAYNTGLTQADVRSVMDELSSIARRHLIKGSCGKFRLLGLSKLERVKRGARKARNPATGETIRLPARQVIKSTPTKTAKDLLKN